MSIEAAHLLPDIGDTAKIEESQQKGVKNGQCVRSTSFADLARILLQGDIATPMEPILNAPVVADQLKQAQGGCLLRCQARDAIDIFLGTAQRIFDSPTETKDLSNFVPIAGQEIIEFRGGLNEPAREPPVPFVSLHLSSPIQTIKGRFAKEETEILGKRGLVLLHEEQILSTRSDDLLTDRFLGVKSIRAKNTSLQEERREKG